MVSGVISYPPLEGLALKVFNDRYSLKDKDGRQLEEKPEEMWERVSRVLARVEKTEAAQQYWAMEFYRALEGFKFVPGGRILSGAGAEGQVTFYNCFVLPSPDDSRGGIMDSVKTMVEILARGGGAGVNLSSLRPRGTYVKGVNGAASGSVSFGGLYSFATGLVIQGGSRRGALMLMLDDSHPDIEEFITVKRTMGMLDHANLSVCVSDRFMAAVQADGDWQLEWGGRVYKTIKARSLWDLITESAHASGEPGLVFTERAQKESNTWYFEKIVSVNPCGEQPLPAWGVCNLGSINLAAFVSDGRIDWETLKFTVRTATRILDNVIDSTPYPFPQNREAQMKARRIGLGTMGLADFLLKLKVRYGSPAGIKLVREVYQLIRDESYRASVELAREKGAFPAFEAAKFLQGAFIKRLPDDIRAGIREQGIRNAVLLTQAPTGTTSMLAGTSSGIEPVFDFAFKRRDRLGEHVVYHPLYKEYVASHPHAPAPDYFVSARDLTPLEHVTTQAAIQEFVDVSISKTVNAPEEHTPADVKLLYEKAYELGCKGVTYFRENSRSEAVLESLPAKPKNETAPASNAAHSAAGRHPQERPEIMAGKTYKVTTPYGKLYVTINNNEAGAPFEIFATIGKSGGFFAESSEAICRLVSLSLRSQIAPDEVTAQLKGIRGPMFALGRNGAKILSLPDAIAQVLERHIRGEQGELKLDDHPMAVAPQATLTEASIANHGLAPQCPACGGILVMSEGCQSCPGCGFSKCG